MASERQIEANRRNAEKSTGPRSVPGRGAPAETPIAHGLTSSQSGAAFAKRVEGLARKIAGRTTDAITLERARVRTFELLAVNPDRTQ